MDQLDLFKQTPEDWDIALIKQMLEDQEAFNVAYKIGGSSKW